MARTDEEKLLEHLDTVNSVAEKYLEGSTPSEIATTLGFSRQRVVALLNDWRELIANNEAIHQRAREAVVGADQHYSSLTRRVYAVADEAETQGDLKAQTAALKLVMDIEKTRLDMLHRAGLLDNREVAEEMARLEEKHEVIIGILKDIAVKYPAIRAEILERLGQVSDTPVAISA